MAKLPQVKWSRLNDTKKGALVTAANPNGQLLLGLRAGYQTHEDDPEQAVFVALRAGDNGGITATLIPWNTPGAWVINGNTRVVNHSDAWSIYVNPVDWHARAQTCHLRPRNQAGYCCKVMS